LSNETESEDNQGVKTQKSSALDLKEMQLNEQAANEGREQTVTALAAIVEQLDELRQTSRRTSSMISSSSKTSLRR
jgi:hypothetical protein